MKVSTAISVLALLSAAHAWHQPLANESTLLRPAAPPTDDISLPAISRQSWVQDMGRRGCQYANQVRAQYGRHQLRYSASLTNLGARHSQWMASYNIFQHQNLRGLGAWIGNQWLGVTAENIAMSVPRSRDPAWDAHQQWYYSRGHFYNMISPKHTHCGVGIVYDRSGRWWGTQLFGYNPRIGDEGGAGVAATPPRAPAAAPARAPGPAPAPAPAPASGGGSGGLDIPEFDVNSTPQGTGGGSNSPAPAPAPAPAGGNSPLSGGDGLPTSMIGEPLSVNPLEESGIQAPSL